MTKLRVFFIVSIIILVGVTFSIIYLLPAGQDDTELRNVQIIEGENEWIFQCDITNTGEADVEYTIRIKADNTLRRDIAVVQPGKTYTYICHISRQGLDEGKITFSLYEAGKSEPVEQATYLVN